MYKSLEHPFILIVSYLALVLLCLPALVVLGLLPREVEVNYLFLALAFDLPSQASNPYEVCEFVKMLSKSANASFKQSHLLWGPYLYRCELIRDLPNLY